MRVRVLIRPKAGILDPQGQAVERALPALGFEGVANVHVGRLVELDVPTRRWCRRCARSCSTNPLIEDYEIQVRFGVVRFPGSCDEVDALLAASRVGAAEILWHADADLKGVDAVIVPGGFSYGDYLRAGAIARVSPIMGEVERFARRGGLVLGICNGFQVLCEAGLLSGALLPNTSLRFTCRQVALEVVNASTSWTNACTVGERLSIPAKHMRAATRRPIRCWTSSRPTGRSCSATPPGRTSTARRGTSRACRTPRATSSG